MNEGEVVGGEPKGFHWRPKGVDPDIARMAKIVQAPDVDGVYEASVELRVPQTGKLIPKKGVSSIFPDSWANLRVQLEVASAYKVRRLIGKTC